MTSKFDKKREKKGSSQQICLRLLPKLTGKRACQMPEISEQRKYQKFQYIRWIIEFQLVSHNVTRGSLVCHPWPSVTTVRQLCFGSSLIRRRRGNFPANNAMQGPCGPCKGCPYGTCTDLAVGAVVAPHGLTARV